MSSSDSDSSLSSSTESEEDLEDIVTDSEVSNEYNRGNEVESDDAATAVPVVEEENALLIVGSTAVVNLASSEPNNNGEQVVDGGSAPGMVSVSGEIGEKSSSKSKAPSWNGERLFPPSRKIAKPSKAWKFGGFRKTPAGFLVLDETICSLCGRKQKYRNSPTNLTQHLTAEHPLEFGGIKVDTEPKIKDFFPPKSEKTKYKFNHPRQKALRAKLVEWVLKSNRPLSVVEDEKLVEAFEIADEKFKMPKREAIRSDIIELHKKKKEETIAEFSNTDFFTCTNDAGSSSGGKSFVDINVHYVTEDFYLKKKILDVLEMKESKTAVNYRKRVKNTEKDFGIEGKVFSYTTDNEPTMNAAFPSKERNGCFAHIESKASKKALDKQKTLKIMRSKLRKISKKANKSSKFKYAIQNQQKKKGLRILSLKQEVKTRFTATHTCVRSFLNDPNEKKDAPIDEIKVDENINAINLAMKDAKFKKTEISKLEIKPEDTMKMKELVKVLDVLEEGITLIGGEKFSTGSAVLPFLNKFNKVLETDEDEPLYISSFKTDLKAEMKTRCDANLNKQVLAKASFFDKRFCQLKFLEKDDKEEVMEEIKDELKALEAEEISKNKNKPLEVEEPPKKKRFLGAGLADSDEEESVGGVDDELDNYIKERKLKSDADPFEWWRNRRFEYPLMSKLARKYLAVQGTSTPAERVISRLGAVLTKRRQSLTGELFSKMMFLSDTI